MAVAVAQEVARRLANESLLETAIDESRKQTLFPSVGWRPHSMAAGRPGLALLFGALDRSTSSDGWDKVAHRELSLAVDALPGHPGPSLFSGLAGVGFAAAMLAGESDRYRRLMLQIDTALATRVHAGVSRLSGRSGLSVGEFDVITGLTGIGAHLLLRRGQPQAADALDELLRCLTELLCDEAEPRRWHTPPELSGDALREQYPEGNLNCGLAHGLPGPLALLAIAALEDMLVDRQLEAIATSADWLASHRVAGPWGPDWPNAIPLSPPETSGVGQTEPIAGRAAWCYGAPGVARALYLAGHAIDNESHCRLAIDAMLGIFARPTEARGHTSPTFCHGTAGMVQITLRFARDTAEPRLLDATEVLLKELLETYEPDSLLGYRNVEVGGVVVDQPGLLDGAAGVALALLAAGMPTDPAWDRLFLLS